MPSLLSGMENTDREGQRGSEMTWLDGLCIAVLAVMLVLVLLLMGMSLGLWMMGA